MRVKRGKPHQPPTAAPRLPASQAPHAPDRASASSACGGGACCPAGRLAKAWRAAWSIRCASRKPLMNAPVAVAGCWPLVCSPAKKSRVPTGRASSS
eukprot:scaffold57039_cov63-Phaeocystis_antarctica.AAC.1